MARTFTTGSLPWRPVRPELAQRVYGRTLLDGPTKAVLTRVAPGGCFALHVDPYAHLFLFLSGTGRMLYGARSEPVSKGSVVQIAAGEIHGYENTSADAELLLLSLNIPPA